MRGNLNYCKIKPILDRLLSDNFDIKKEFGLFKRLYKTYPDFDFWFQFPAKKKYTSMVYYISKWGRAELDKDWTSYEKSRIEKSEEEFNFLDFEQTNTKYKIDDNKAKKSIIDLLR